jgi:hypothetical protein
MDNKREFIEVGKLYLVKEEEQFISVEWMMNENVTTKNAAAELIDFLKRCTDNSTWVVNTVLRIKEGDNNAQVEDGGDQSGNTDKQGTGELEQTPSN